MTYDASTYEQLHFLMTSSHKKGYNFVIASLCDGDPVYKHFIYSVHLVPHDPKKETLEAEASDPIEAFGLAYSKIPGETS